MRTGLAGRGLDAEFICHDHVEKRVCVGMWISVAAACVTLPDASAAVEVAMSQPNALAADPFPEKKNRGKRESG